MDTMWIIFLVLIYLLLTTLFLGLSIGIGFTLHWLLPKVDLGVVINEVPETEEQQLLREAKLTLVKTPRIRRRRRED
jgi:hypothetical protein